MKIDERSIGFAMTSRKEVLANEKFEQIFGAYADAIGINTEQTYPGWAEHQLLVDKVAAEKEIKRLAEQARLAKVEEEKKIAEEKA